MTDEEIVRFEARHFLESEKGINQSGNQVLNENLVYISPHIFKEQVEDRLKDFYTPKNKAHFLEEIKSILETTNKSYIKNTFNEDIVKKIEVSLYYIQQFIDELPAILTTKNQTNLEKERKSIFISYSHADRNYVDEFKRHFKNLQRNHPVDLWDDSKIKPGQKWEDEIRSAMAKAKIVIFVISADFFVSDFIANKELPVLLKRADDDGATILNLFIKPCDITDSPLASIQGLNAPSHTVLQMSEFEREQLWASMVTQVRERLSL